MTNATMMNKAVIADVSNRSLSELFSLKDRVVVVTGGTAGIGLATCKRLIEPGACVLVAGNYHRLQGIQCMLRNRNRA